MSKYPYRDKKPEQTSNTETSQQGTAPVGNAPSKDNKQLEDLNKLIAEYKEILKENRNADEILMANLEGWTDLVAEELTQRFFGAVNPFLQEQQQQINRLQIAINSAKDEVRKVGKRGGIKGFLFWLSIICNIGIAGFLIYLLITKGAIF